MTKRSNLTGSQRKAKKAKAAQDAAPTAARVGTGPDQPMVASLLAEQLTDARLVGKVTECIPESHFDKEKGTRILHGTFRGYIQFYSARYGRLSGVEFRRSEREYPERAQVTFSLVTEGKVGARVTRAAHIAVATEFAH